MYFTIRLWLRKKNERAFDVSEYAEKNEQFRLKEEFFRERGGKRKEGRKNYS
jgi:hypothetical protein